MTVPAASAWKTNGHMIADVAKLGYISGRVLDLTPGEGVWWKQWQPESLTLLPTGVDFRHTGYTDASFDTVAYDPPYKLNGTPTPEVDARYGVHVPAEWWERMELMREGLTEAARIVAPTGHVLVKCQDQVARYQIRWQTLDMVAHAAKHELDLVDRFDLLGKARVQPMGGRTQRHAHGRSSTLLVFQRIA